MAKIPSGGGRSAGRGAEVMRLHVFRSLLTRGRRLLAVHQARGRDPDLEQAILRVGLGGLILGYALSRLLVADPDLLYGLQIACVVMTLHVMFGAWQIWYLRATRHPTPRLRVAGIVVDMAASTIGMSVTGEFGVPLVGMFLFVTVGNGFRFGPRYLLIAYWMSLAGFTSIILFNDFWIHHRAVGVGLLLTLAVVPLYVLVLLTRLTAQKDAAEQLSNAKSRFVANVSHELRTPLTGVFAVYDLLQQRRMPPDERELVGMLGSAVATLKVSVDAVLQMSKLEAGAETATLRPFNLHYFVQQMSAQVKPQATAKGLSWNVQVDAQVPATVSGDKDHLSHVIGNLLNNAFKFTHAGGVTLRVACVADRTRFEIADTGIGISLELQEHLFERFVQADSSKTRRYGGTGLGTAIARELAELMGGQIGVVSAPGQGSTFWVEVPLVEVTDAVPPASDIRGMAQVVAWSEAEAAEVARAAEACGLTVAVRAPEASAEAPMSSPAQPFAVAFVMNAQAAADCLQARLGEVPALESPCIVIAPDPTPGQSAMLYRAGAVAVVPAHAVAHSLPVVLAGLANRLETQATSALAEATARGVVRPLRIVLADDNKANRLLLARILSNAGHTVLEAERGDSAFDLMGDAEVDLAILDLNMPEMSGPDAVKLQRAGEIGASRLPILIVSADATPAAREESLLAGADEFLTKPVSASLLLAAIERVVAGIERRGEAPRATTLRGDQRAAEGGIDGNAVQGLVDPDRIAALRRIARGDAAFMEKYVLASLSDLDLAMTALSEAAATGELRAARDALHAMEGTAASLGARAVVAGCRTVRSHVETPLDPDLPAALASLSMNYALTKSTVRASLHSERQSAARSPWTPTARP